MTEEAESSTQKENAALRSFYKRIDGQTVGAGTNALIRKNGESDKDFFERMEKMGWLGPDKPHTGHWTPDNNAYHAGTSDGCTVCAKGTRRKARHARRMANSKLRIPIVQVGRKTVLKGKPMMSVLIYVPSEFADAVDQISDSSIIQLKQEPSAASSVTSLPNESENPVVGQTDKDEVELGNKTIPVKQEE